MKIFLIGHPKSGKTVMAKSLVGFKHVTGQLHFEMNSHLSVEDLKEDYKNILLKGEDFDLNYIKQLMNSYMDSNFVIDGITDPKVFISLFDPNKDMVVFLNRLNNDIDVEDYQNISLCIIKDYCFWMSSIGILDKRRWIEYNFRIPGEDSKVIKELGTKNSVFVIKSLNNVITHLKDIISCATTKQLQKF